MTTQPLTLSSEKRVYENILQTIGRTPLVRLQRSVGNIACRLYAKIEGFNPGGSVKDRIALRILEAAERSGELRPGGTVVEATSGNTGVGLAIVAAIKGYKTIFVMPDKMSVEKIQLLRAYGARVVITPTAVAPEDPRSYYNVARRLVSETPNAILANQYHNPENPRSHYQTTGPEIWDQTGGEVTDVVIGMGTGGTISGVGQYLKEMNPAIKMIGVDPVGSILLETWQRGQVPDDVEATTYKVEGIGEDFLPTTLDLSMVDEVIRVSDKESFRWTRRLLREEGIFCGGSSGTALAAAVRYARNLPPDRLVVVLLPDSGYRYLSKVFDDKWMRENGFLETAWSDMTLGEVLAKKPQPSLIAVSLQERLVDVIALLKANDISQVPVTDEAGQVAGMVTEVDLLKYLLEQPHPSPASVTIDEVVQPLETVYATDTPLEDVLPRMMEGAVVIAAEAGKPVGIITKIDLIDFMAGER